MLHKKPNIVSSKTFSLIQQLQSHPELKGFFLVGGTALALQLGHRNSIDIDLFTQSDFNTQELGFFLKTKFDIRLDYERDGTLLTLINNIKVDFIKHAYSNIKPPILEEGITFLSMEDISAMKLNAVINSGQRLKDFIDIYFLMEHFSLKDMLQFFETKYPNTNALIALKALTYFDDIDETLQSPKVVRQVTFTKIKERINNAVVHTNKIFTGES